MPWLPASAHWRTEMTKLFLLAQLAAPACGWNYGAQITPENSYVLGCSVPDASGVYGTVLRMDPFTPGGIRTESAAPAPLPVFTP